MNDSGGSRCKLWLAPKNIKPLIHVTEHIRYALGLIFKFNDFNGTFISLEGVHRFQYYCNNLQTGILAS